MLHDLSRTIAILEREHDRLVTLVVEGPPHLRSMRLRQLKFLARRLVAARADEARIANPATEGGRA